MRADGRGKALAKRSGHPAERIGQQGDDVEPIEQQIEAIMRDRVEVADEDIERMRRVVSAAMNATSEALKQAEAAAQEWTKRQDSKSG
jgi:ElaB/YqjD/DUF883 family membrane-anchored ribosome-binding protein